MTEVEPDADGNVSILFTDVEGSTKGWESFLEQMSASLAVHDRILHEQIAAAGGYVFSLAGDSFGAVFGNSEVALDVALKVQAALATTTWPDDYKLRVRMSLHCGPVIQRDNGAYGPEIVRAAILCEIGHAGQILLTEEFAKKLDERACRPLGTHRLRKISEPQAVFQYGQEEFAQLRNVISKSCTVPASRNTLVGRDLHIEELIRLLENNRLLTLSGPGGVGKTRLACDIALRLFDHNYDGVHLVDLDALSGDRDLLGAFAHGLDLTLVPDGDAIEQLEAALKNRRTLLVVDNCEHLIGPAARIVDQLLISSPELSVIATSREPLGVSGELVWRVPPLAEGTNSPAVELFVRSAQQGSGPTLDTPELRQQIDRICTLLDGLPLAIELAAARTRMLSVPDIAELLEDHLRTLRLRGGRNTHRSGTLNDVVEWSHNLLDEDEQVAFRRLGVFRSGFALEDVPAIIGSDIDEAHELVDALIGRSLLETVSTGSGVVRVRMLNTIRAYALKKLAEADELEQVSARHAEHFLQLAERPRHPYMPSPKVSTRHEAEYLNLRAAADWAIKAGDPATAARIAAGCVIEIDRRGEFENGIRWSKSVFGASDEVAFNAMTTEAFLRGQEGNLQVESAIAQRAVDLAADEPYRLLPVAITLASLEAMTHDPARSRAQMMAAYKAAERSDQSILNMAFIDIHMASWDLLSQEPETLLERLKHYDGGMVPYARVCAHLELGNTDAAEAVLKRAAVAPADAWIHFNDLGEALYLVETGAIEAAAVRLVESAARHSGLRRWQDGDFLIHFAVLHMALGDTDRAEFLLDNSRTRHGLISWVALSLKQTLRGWPTDYDATQSLAWLSAHYSFDSTTKILEAHPGLLNEETETWRSYVDRL